jgi:hypothetical protein
MTLVFFQTRWRASSSGRLIILERGSRSCRGAAGAEFFMRKDARPESLHHLEPVRRARRLAGAARVGCSDVTRRKGARPIRGPVRDKPCRPTLRPTNASGGRSGRASPNMRIASSDFNHVDLRKAARASVLSHLPSVRVQASTPSEMTKLPRSKLNCSRMLPS